MTPSEIIRELNIIQHAKSISNVALIEKTGISKATLWRIQNEHVPATLIQISSMAKALGFELSLNKL